MAARSPFAGITREQRRQLERDNAKFPTHLLRQPREGWSDHMRSEPKLIEVWRSRDFLVQVFAEQPGVTRLSVNRTTVDPEQRRWADGITWDELQRLKSECGRGDYDAVEVYPRDRDVVDVANLRHLWVLVTSIPFAWRRDRSARPAIRSPSRVEGDEIVYGGRSVVLGPLGAVVMKE